MKNDVFHIFKYVIFGVPIDVPLDEIKEIAVCENVTRITRRTNGTETGTETSILTYDRELVLSVTLKNAFLSYKVRRYITNPMQCKHCFEFGHTAIKALPPHGNMQQLQWMRLCRRTLQC